MHFAVIRHAVCLTCGQQAIYLFFSCSNTKPGQKKQALSLDKKKNIKT